MLEQAPSTLLSAEAGSLDHYSRIHQRIAKVNHELHLELLAAHGESEELLRFAAQCNEWERVLSHHVDERNAPAAIEVLRGVRRARAETPAEVERLCQTLRPEPSRQGETVSCARPGRPSANASTTSPTLMVTGMRNMHG